MTATLIDLDAYFARVGYDGPRAATLETLRALHRLHPQAIAFENLDPLLRRPVALDADALQRKLVNSGRGGYCYEQNLLFIHVLRAIGFTVHEHTARVLWNRPEGVRMPRTHLLSVVEAEGRRYVADVGFGGNVLTGPLLLDDPAIQQTPHEPYRIVPEAGDYTIEFKIRDAWMKLLRFDLSEQIFEDHEMGNWFVSTHPQSVFVNGLMAARPEPGRRYALANNVLTVHDLKGGSDKRALNARELRDALADLFKLRLDGLEGLDGALSRLAEGSS
ncbi:MAG: arylamine N-acetyltransferase [Pseudolabrys sp.]